MFRFGLLRDGTILLRGTNGLVAKKGQIIEDPAYVSTTIRPKVAYQFGTIIPEKPPAILKSKDFCGTSQKMKIWMPKFF